MNTLIIDTGSLYGTLLKKFSGKINFEALLTELELKYGKIEEKKIYTFQNENEASRFHDMLRCLGFQVLSKKPTKTPQGHRINNWLVPITMDLVLGETDMIIVSHDKHLVPAYVEVLDQGRKLILVDVDNTIDQETVTDIHVITESVILNGEMA